MSSLRRQGAIFYSPMKKLSKSAVIGNPISHSLSPLIHHHFAKQVGIELEYQKILGGEREFQAQVNKFFHDGGIGLNVTMPFKSLACDIAINHTDIVKQTGVANTLWCNKRGELCADNTDGVGLEFALTRLTDVKSKKLLILGAGGAVLGVLPKLLTQSFSSITISNRSAERLEVISNKYPQLGCKPFCHLKQTDQFDIIINATSTDASGVIPEIPYSFVTHTICLDMFYDLKKDTPFVTKCKENNAAVVSDGLAMLIGQAAASFYRWHGCHISRELTLKALEKEHD